jgi:hypothetical protein
MWVARNTQIAGHHHGHDHHDHDHGVVQEMPKLGVKLLVILIIIIIIWGCKKTLCPKWLAGKFVLFFPKGLEFFWRVERWPSLSLSVSLSHNSQQITHPIIAELCARMYYSTSSCCCLCGWVAAAAVQSRALETAGLSSVGGSWSVPCLFCLDRCDLELLWFCSNLQA